MRGYETKLENDKGYLSFPFESKSHVSKKNSMVIEELEINEEDPDVLDLNEVIVIISNDSYKMSNFSGKSKTQASESLINDYILYNGVLKLSNKLIDNEICELKDNGFLDKKCKILSSSKRKSSEKNIKKFAKGVKNA